MDKTILKKFATESRIDLMDKIRRKINLLYVDEQFNKEIKGDIVVLSNDKRTITLTKEEYNNREKLLKRIRELGINSVIEESAYTWFNRIVAIRYMEVHDFLPLSNLNNSLGFRVLTNQEDLLIPEILKFSNLLNDKLDINFNKNEYIKLDTDEKKYKYILLLVCKKISKIIPQVFGGITDYIDLLIPDNLLSENGFIYKVVSEIPKEYFKNVEIIGWLYQYYIAEKHDEVVDPLRKKGMKKDEIPAATQLFTPDWIVKYMVENSLGKYALEHGASESLKQNWKYYVDSEIKIKENKLPTEITFIDPCCGSGHILVYAFEIFMQIYQSYGYNSKDIPSLILENNIFGLDIDNRAGQLSILSIILKAREYDKDLFNKQIIQKLNIMALQDSNGISLDNYSHDLITQSDISYLINTFKHAKEIGSLLNVKKNDYSMTLSKLENNIFDYILGETLKPLIKQAEILSQKYNVVVTNPPYLSKMSKNLKEYVYDNYKMCASDIFSAFIVKNMNSCTEDGYSSYLTPNVWLSIKTYEELRKYVIENRNIDSLIFLAHSSFNSIACVDVCTFTLSNNDCAGTYIKLSEFKGGLDIQEQKVLEALSKKECDYIYHVNSDIFKDVPGCPITVFSASQKMIDIYKNAKLLLDVADPKQGIATSNNDKFVRFWYEVSYDNIYFNCSSHDDSYESNLKWYPYNKGGIFRKWYGNNDRIINWYKDGIELKKYDGAVLRNPEYYFKECISWSLISSYTISFRYKPAGFLFDVAGMSCFKKPTSEVPLKYLLGLNNSCLIGKFMLMLAPTINYQVGNISNIPVIYSPEYANNIINIVEENISLTKQDWDLYETSWDFKCNPLILQNKKTIKECIDSLILNLKQNFDKLEKNEEKLNELFIKIYNVEGELSPKTNKRDISITSIYKDKTSIPEELRESYYVRTYKDLIVNFISYAVGCMFGRYSLDEPGIVLAGGSFDKSSYVRYNADTDNIIPISDEDDVYYNDDIVGKFKNFVEIVFGKESLNSNLDFIAEILGKKDTENSIDTIRRYFVNDFYKDHVQMYQKKPIYWQFESGKNRGFQCLIYIHRYNEQIISKLRVDYLHKTESSYKRIREDIDYKLNNLDLSVSDKKNINNKKIIINNKITECSDYDEKVGHLANQLITLNLDDGIKSNYDKLSDILTKIK